MATRMGLRPNWPKRGIGHYAANWVGGANACEWTGKSFFAESNVVAQGARLWSPPTRPDFLLPAGSPARAKGIDLSRPFEALGRRFPALPGMKRGYFSGSAPDVGAVP